MKKSGGSSPYKPILPKINNRSVVITRRFIEVAASKPCFVCDGPVIGAGTPMLSITPTSGIDLPSKIGHIMGDKFMVIVSEDDVLCKKCYGLIIHVEKLENELNTVKHTLTEHLKSKYSLEDKPSIVNEAESTILETEPQEYFLINEDDLSENQEPSLKKSKNLFRPIQPKTKATCIDLLKCSNCTYLTTSTASLLAHKALCSTSSMYMCTMCDKKFDSQKMIRSHKMEAHLSKWTCHFCDLSFTDGDCLTVHMKKHLGEKSDNFTITKCEKVVEDKKTYKCSICDECFDDGNELQNHITTHSNTVTFTCKHCDEKCNSKEELVIHIQTHTTEVKKQKRKIKNMPVVKQNELLVEDLLKCPHCSLNFLQNELYEDHLLTHNTVTVSPVLDTSVENDKSTELDMSDTGETKAQNDSCASCVSETDDGNPLDVLNLFQVLDKPDQQLEEQPDEQFDEVKEKKSKTYVCADCSFSTRDIDLLQQHFTEEHNTTLNTVLPKEELSNTQDISLKKDRKLYTCKYCPNSYISKRSVTIHEQLHPESKTTKCPDCTEMFSTDKFLNEHRELFHPEFHCRFCSKSFTNIKQLKAHESRHTSGTKHGFTCNFCDKSFQTPTGLRLHEANHTGEYNHKCEYCSKGFVSRVSYEEHRASHTKEERYKCDICSKKFSFQATYWIHRKWHDNPYPYQCEFCNRRFKHTSLLSVHRRKHTGERPYQCHVCDQTFPVGNTLKRHLSLHTGIFPYSCNLCEKGFTAKYKLASHMDKVHQNKELLIKQYNSKNKNDFKMIVKEEPQESVNQVASADNQQEWMLQMANGENISCTLLTDEVLSSINTNPATQVVELCFNRLSPNTHQSYTSHEHDSLLNDNDDRSEYDASSIDPKLNYN